MLDVALPVAGVVVGVPLGVVLERFIADRAERRRMRRDVLRRFAAHRYVLTERGWCPESEFWAVLNEVIVAYIDDRDVLDELHTFRGHVGGDGFRSEHIVPLMQAMARAAKLDAEQLDSELIQYPFAAPPRSES